MAKVQPKEPLDQKTYAHYFAALGIILVICTIVSLIQEFSWRRPYKGLQTEFRKVASQEIDAQLGSARTRFEALKATPEYLEAKKAAEASLAAYKAPENQEREKSLLKEMGAVSSELQTVRSELRNIRGGLQEAVYYYEKQGDTASREKVRRLDPQVREMSAKMLALDARRKELKGQIQDLKQPHQDAAIALDAFAEEVRTLSRRLSAVKNMEGGIKQLFNTEINLVDRCTTCHLGVDVPGLEALPQEYSHFRTHPKVTDEITGEEIDLLQVHDVNRIGCTPCHDGQGYATTTAEKGHGEVHFWTEPLLRKSDPVAPGLNSAACLKCHFKESRLAGAETLMRGKRLVKELGCWGCHKIKGIGDEEERFGEASQQLKGLEKALAVVQKKYDAKVKAGEVNYDDGPTFEDTTELTNLDLLTKQQSHRVRELGLDVRRIGPSLKRLKEKLYSGWLPVWLRNPHAWRPTTKMPNFFPPRTAGFYLGESADDIQTQTDREVKALAAFLWQSSAGEVPVDTDQPASPQDVAVGKALVDEVGCFACHRIGDTPMNPGNGYGPDLSRIGEKANRDWLARWVENPRKLMHDAKMPSLRLSPEESRLIAAYLSTLKQNEPKPMPDWIDNEDLGAEGKMLVERYGCYGCHEIKGMEYGKGKVGTELSGHGSKLVEEFDFGLHERTMKKEGLHTRQGWISKKLAEVRSYDQGRFRHPEERLRMPQFNLTPDDVAAITTFLLGNVGEEFHPGYRYEAKGDKAAILEGWRLVEKFNCTGCHIINGVGGYVRSRYGERPEDLALAPPDLTGEGRKVQPMWLIGFLKQPVTLRPFLKIRMPTFEMSEYEAEALARFFAALEAEPYPFEYRPERVLTDAEKEGATQIFNTLQCLKCHVVPEGKLSAEEAATKAPNLVLAGQRLQPEWVQRWLENPGAIQSNTRMPSFWQNGMTMFPNVLDGDAKKQMEVLTHFVLNIEDMGVDLAPPKPAGDGDFFDDDEEDDDGDFYEDDEDED